jgi:hypothetical protein
VRRGLVVAVVVALSRDAAADKHLAQGRAAVAAANFGDAQALLTAALTSGAYGPSEVADIYRLSGITQASVGDSDKATDAFAHLVALSPDEQLPPGTSPRVLQPFAAARAQLAGRALRAKVNRDGSHLTVTIAEDPLAMVDGVRVTVSVDGKTPLQIPSVATPPTFVAEVPTEANTQIDAELVDQYGNRLAALPPVVVVSAANPPAPPPVAGVAVVRPVPVAQPIYLRWYVYAAPTALALGIATGFGIATQSAISDLNAVLADAPHHTFAQAVALQQRADRDANDANVTFAIAGAFAAATAAVAAYDFLRPRHRERLAAVPTRGGAAVSCQVRF